MSWARNPIGFIGLGQMGKPMARNLLRDDTELRIWSRRPDAYAELTAHGARVAEGLAGMAATRLVFLCLPDTEAVEKVLFGTGGLLEVLTAGAIVVDTSTIAHGATLAIHERLARAGLGFLDAPVSGMQARAEAATLSIMCGGTADTFEAARPWLARLGNQVLHMGPAGSGQLAKLVNQLLFDINCAALAEILPMAASLGLDPGKTAAVVNGGTGRSHASEFFLPRILRGHFADGYPLAAAYKDLVSAAELGAARAVPMPVLAAATATYQMALRAGHGGEDKGAMIRVFEALLGVRFRSEAGPG
ncbi:MAG: NAD(P)-dependent oxidoreductase [Bordetella sp.]|nr:NAD(P)-dependent oxidoreductase [Bordetella sp.]